MDEGPRSEGSQNQGNLGDPSKEEVVEKVRVGGSTSKAQVK